MQGMPKLELEIAEEIEFSKISLIAIESQIDFSLDCFIIDKGAQCQARLEINAEINMLMKMMLENPLTQFLNSLASAIGVDQSSFSYAYMNVIFCLKSFILLLYLSLVPNLYLYELGH